MFSIEMMKGILDTLKRQGSLGEYTAQVVYVRAIARYREPEVISWDDPLKKVIASNLCRVLLGIIL